MCRKTILFIAILIALQVVPVGNIFAADVWWRGKAGNDSSDYRWSTANNWWGVLGADARPPGMGDNAYMDQREGGGPLYGTIDSNCPIDPNTGAVTCINLIVGDWSQDPCSGDRKATLDVNQQTLDVTGDLTIGNMDTIWWSTKATGDVNVVNGGKINVAGDMWVGREGIGNLNVRNGDVNIIGTLRCPGGPLAYYGDQRYRYGEGYITLYIGGTIKAADIYSYNEFGDIAKIDIRGGTLILNGDKVSQIADLMSQGRLQAYGGGGNILCDFDVTNPGKTTVTSTYDPNLASSPNPANYATGVSLSAQLSWAKSSAATSHDVYFGTSFSDVNTANHSSPPGIYKGNQTPDSNTTYNPGPLTPAQTFYWRIDEVSGTTYKGNVWRFTSMNPYIASAPNPSNNATAVLPEKMLSWTKGILANKHKVYLGTSFDDVNNAVTPTATTTEPNYTPGNLSFDQTYYWRIDEVNEANNNTWKGLIWRFTTLAYKTIDNFEWSSPPVSAVWIPYGGASVNRTISTPANDGNAMVVNYNNTGSPWDSEVNYALPSTAQLNKRDWSSGGVKILSISFHGDPNNINAVEQLYVTAIDSNSHNFTVAYFDSNDIGQQLSETWHRWVIDLKKFSDGGINLTDIRQLIIGLGDRNSPGTKGTVYFDNIRLYPSIWSNSNNNMAIRLSTGTNPNGADLDNDGSVDMNDFAIFARDWRESSYDINATALPDPDPDLLLWYKFDADDKASQLYVYDHSGHGYDGTLYGSSVGSHWDPCGYDGGTYSYDFNSTKSLYLEVPETAVADTNLGGHSTVAFWIKDYGQPDGKMLFQIGPSTGNRGNLQVWSGWTGDYTYICGEYPVTGYRDETFWGRYGYTNPGHILGQWTHYAFTKDHTTGIMRIYRNGEAVAEYKSASASTMPAVVYSQSFFTIGAWRYPDNVGGYYTGKMDDFRLYKRALSQGEIMSLAGVSSLTQPVLSSANLVADNQVNFKDLAIMVDLWLKQPLLWP
ncbi:MAG: LamG-like jellyroll fold domain-containing protein [Sedimentisphaerales bacterium]